MIALLDLGAHLRLINIIKIYWWSGRSHIRERTLQDCDHTIAFLIHKRYIPDPEQLNQQRFKCAAQMREPL
jgi:hypothetical protein